MKTNFKFALFLFVACVTARADVRWKDEKTGARFMLISAEPMSYHEAYRACSSKGWDVFNYDYLTAEEQERFRDAVELKDMRWERKLVGEPGERSEATIWGSSSSGAITSSPYSGAVSRLFLQQFHDEKTRRARVIWGGMENGKNHTACMYLSHTWEGCSHEMKCTFEQPDGGTYAIRYSLMEYGPHRGIAMARIKDRIKEFSMTGGRCELALRDPICLSYRQ